MSKKKKIPWGIKAQFIFGNLLKLIKPAWTFNQIKTTKKSRNIWGNTTGNTEVGKKEILSYTVLKRVRAFSQDDLTDQHGKTFTCSS